MALNIDIGTVKSQLNSFVAKTGECVSIMKKINNDYIEATQQEWNTPAAATYIDGLCGAFNDYISQFNSKFQEGIDDFVAGVNALTENENAEIVSNVSIELLPELSKSWSGNSTQFNIPENYEGFTNVNLTGNIGELSVTLDGMQDCINTAVQSGLADSFCTNLRSSLEALKASAAEIANEYSGKAAERAVNQDTNISTIKSNT